MKNANSPICIDCQRPFSEIKKYKNTNLFIECFNKGIHQEDEELITIYEGPIEKIYLIKDLLENNKIKTFLKDEHMGILTPTRISASGIAPFKIMISNKQAIEAKQIIKNFLNENIEIPQKTNFKPFTEAFQITLIIIIIILFILLFFSLCS